MGFTVSDLSPIRTQPVYYRPSRFQAYKIIHYEPNPTKGVNGLTEFDREYRSDYIVGVGNPLGHHKSEYPAGSYEWFVDGCAKFDSADFLQCALTTGARLLLDEKYRTGKIEDWQNEIIMEFCGKYGLDVCDELLNTQADNGDQPPYDTGCNVWSYVRKLEELSIQLRRIDQLLGQPLDFKWAFVRELEKRGMPRHTAEQITQKNLFPEVRCEASLTEMCLYSIKEKRMKSLLYANSLLDVAFYQFGKVISDGVFVRKCANPACPQVIIGGRSDKRTCSSACRKALERYQKNRPQC